MRFGNTTLPTPLTWLIGFMLVASACQSADVAAESNAAPASIATPAPVTLFKDFDPAVIAPGGTTTVIFEIDNTANQVQVGNVEIVDNLPVGMVVANSPDVVTLRCLAGTVLAPPGATTIRFSGGIAPAADTCEVRVKVTTSTVGIVQNVASMTTDSGQEPFGGPGILEVESPTPTLTPTPCVPLVASCATAAVTPIALTPIPLITPTPTPTPCVPLAASCATAAVTPIALTPIPVITPTPTPTPTPCVPLVASCATAAVTPIALTPIPVITPTPTTP